MKEIKDLLKQTNILLTHEKEKEKLKGENFNVFSVLKMEYKENSSHSAFIAELLNPMGSHLQGDLFAKLFINHIKNQIKDLEINFSIHHFNIDHIKLVRTEKNIGNRDDKNKTGGRVDIFIKDNVGNTICIENKINAADQYAQLERYYNYNKNKNTVVYLTLHGSKPSDESANQLEPNKDFVLLSYKSDIVDWLTLCLKESAEIPILRESIKQYILLIKKITNTMTSENQELFDLLLEKRKAALTIAANVDKPIYDTANEIRNMVCENLKLQFGNSFHIYKGKNVNENHSQIWIKFKGKDEKKIFFGIQSFAQKRHEFTENLFVGIFVCNGQYDKEEHYKLGPMFSNWWINVVEIPSIDENIPTHLRSIDIIIKLRKDNDFKEKFVNHIVKHAVEYIDKNKDLLASHLKDI